MGNGIYWYNWNFSLFHSIKQISGICNTTMLHTIEGYSYLYSYDCTLVPGNIGKTRYNTCAFSPTTDLNIGHKIMSTTQNSVLFKNVFLYYTKALRAYTGLPAHTANIYICEQSQRRKYFLSLCCIRINT